MEVRGEGEGGNIEGVVRKRKNSERGERKRKAVREVRGRGKQ